MNGKWNGTKCRTEINKEHGKEHRARTSMDHGNELNNNNNQMQK